jgi:hypothetical protein
VWTVTEGLRRDGSENRFYDSQDPAKALESLRSTRPEAIWLFEDLSQSLRRPEIVRQLRDLARPGGDRRSTLVISGPEVTVPLELEKSVVHFDLGPPDEVELRRLVHRVVRDLGARAPVRVELTKEDYDRLVDGMRGMTLGEAERAIARAVVEDRALTAADVEEVRRLKREALHEQGVLDYLPTRPEDGEIGGLEGFRRWLDKRSGAFTKEARTFGLPPPKGVVLLGVQGCGKTMAARCVAARWDLPLFQLEPGRLFDKYVGESEKNLDRALRLAEHLAPAVLLVDEVEKGFSAAGSASLDGGLSRRLLGRLLGWLQDRDAPVFVVATCNDVHELPPEMLRKGRFDEVFFVDLPTPDERKDIFAIHLTRRDRDPTAFDLDRLAAAAEGFSGAEIEQAVVAGMYTAFADSGKLDTEGLLAEVRGTRPLSVLRRESIEALRAWARERTVPAR